LRLNRSEGRPRRDNRDRTHGRDRLARVDVVRSALLIANHDAGSSTKASLESAVRRLEGAGVEVETVATANTSDLEAALDARGDRAVIVAGGDGSLHAVVTALACRGELEHVVVGLIPLGTGNDFARTMGLPLDSADAAAVCADGVTRALDLMVDDAGGVVVNAVNAGIGAEASRRASSLKPRFGRLAYAIGAGGAGLAERGRRLQIVADDMTLADGSARVLQVGIGNGRFVGGGTPLAPHARPSDGQVDVVVSFAVGPLRRIGYAIAVKLRRHLDRRDVVWSRASLVRVSGEPYWCSADGELSGPVTDRTWTVRPQALHLVVPREGTDGTD
jgi:diacylglycerol kinase (ATP)